MAKTLITIPARAGSKGVKGKNMRLLGGEPLLWWALDLAAIFKANYGADIILTTDIDTTHPDVLYYRRPALLCSDTARAWDVWQDAAETASEANQVTYDRHLYLEPTSPCRTLEDLERVLSHLATHDSVFTASPSPLSPGKFFSVAHNRIGITINHDMMLNNAPRQSQGQWYLKNGIAYACTDKHMRESKTMLSEESYVDIIPRPVVNIDTEEDFIFAEALLG